MEEFPIAKADNSINKQMDIMKKTFEIWTFQLSNVYETILGGYKTAWGYAIQADRPPPQAPMNHPR
jgi:hypothetical protein